MTGGQALSIAAVSIAFVGILVAVTAAVVAIVREIREPTDETPKGDAS